MFRSLCYVSLNIKESSVSRSEAACLMNPEATEGEDEVKSVDGGTSVGAKELLHGVFWHGDRLLDAELDYVGPGLEQMGCHL